MSSSRRRIVMGTVVGASLWLRCECGDCDSPALLALHMNANSWVGSKACWKHAVTLQHAKPDGCARLSAHVHVLCCVCKKRKYMTPQHVHCHDTLREPYQLAQHDARSELPRQKTMPDSTPRLCRLLDDIFSS